MSNRLTDEELARIELVANGGSAVLPLFWVWATRMVDEIRERRAADLTTYDVDILRWLRQMLADESFNPDLWETSLAVLDKILRGVRHG